MAALADQAWLAVVKDRIAQARIQIAQIGRDNGLMPLPSATNFVTLDCGGDAAFAKAILDGLVARGIFVRMPFVAPQNRCIRVSCGTDADHAAFAAALPAAIAAAKKG